jgi:uncharacterized protein (TIGR03435 family)
MQAMDDMALLHEYAARNSEAAFETLVARRIDFVHSAALRQVRDPLLAGEVTQAVFVILAQKAARIPGKTNLTGWLFRTTRFTALAQMRAAVRRHQREQEAAMQSEIESLAPDPLWEQMSPLLDEALAQLGETDRAAVLLRFFENKSLAEVGNSLGTGEDTARKRVSRALEKLRKFFAKRGVVSTAAVIAGAMSAHSVQAAPATLAKTISAVAVAKGAGGNSTLTLIKGALKLMAWTKAKMAVVVGVGVLLAAGTATVGIEQFQEHQTYSWELPSFSPVNVVAPTVLGKTPPQVTIVASKYDHLVASFTQGNSYKYVDGQWVPISTNAFISIGVGVTADDIVRVAYDFGTARTFFADEGPKGRYDYIANLPKDSLKMLKEEIRKKFGLVGNREIRETDVLVLKLSNPELQGFKPANSLRGGMTNQNATVLVTEAGNHEETKDGSIQTRFNTPVSHLQNELEREIELPVVDETGLTNRYDYVMFWPVRRTADLEPYRESIKKILFDQLGLELVPSREPIEILVVEKAP